MNDKIDIDVIKAGPGDMVVISLPDGYKIQDTTVLRNQIATMASVQGFSYFMVYKSDVSLNAQKPHVCPKCHGNTKIDTEICPVCSGKGIVWG